MQSSIQFFRLIFPFLLALVITYLARRPVNILVKRKVNRSLAILIVYLVLIVILVAIGVLLGPGIYNNISEVIREMPKLYEEYKPMADMVLKFFSVENALKSLEDTVMILFDMFLSFILAFYLLRDKEQISDFILSFFPVRYRGEALRGMHDISRILSAFITGQLFVAFLVGVLETIGLMLIGAKYPFVMGFIGGLANIVPIVGPVIGAVPAVIIAFMDSPYKALLVALVFIVVQQIDNNILTPRIVEGRLGLHPFVTLSVVFVAGLFWGITGVLLSIPLTAVAVSIVKRIYNIKIKKVGERIGDKSL